MKIQVPLVSFAEPCEWRPTEQVWSVMSDDKLMWIYELFQWLHYPAVVLHLEWGVDSGEVYLSNMALLGGGLGFFLLSVFAGNLYHRTKRHNQLLIEQLQFRNMKIASEQAAMREQHRIASEKSQQLHASLTYARTIQTALLPGEKKLRKSFPKSFALLQPREIVSGDFFWLTEKYDTTYLAVADCTGHGVPGAFMSLIGQRFLEETIHARGVLNPSNILDEMRKSITQSLNQNHLECCRDGLDLSLCSFNKHNNVLCFSGANQPLFVVRSNGTLLENLQGSIYTPDHVHKNHRLYILEGNRQPIGMYHGPTKAFTNFTVKLLPGDRFFAFTDGFRDQFGGLFDKKLKAPRFRNIMLDAQRLPISEQKDLLVRRFHLWKGDKEQNDDVCIVGVEI
ncbi:MAG: hypothetical protein EA392_07970 [Cryomorphaceae bacterium]|nr:MAG: hypothetical protein EA392_07970 [Cryomorphaceae bacterium]